MFKRFRRFLGEFGVNIDFLVVEHVIENTFLFALIVGRSFVFASISYVPNVNDWVLFNGPIICFFFVALVEFSNLLRIRDEHEEVVEERETDEEEEISKEKRKLRSDDLANKEDDEQPHDQLFDKLEKINDLFFDGTASTIIFVSVFIFLHDYYFGADENQKVSMCDDTPNISQQEVLLLSINLVSNLCLCFYFLFFLMISFMFPFFFTFSVLFIFLLKNHIMHICIYHDILLNYSKTSALQLIGYF
jgi:hypothetical protein